MDQTISKGSSLQRGVVSIGLAAFAALSICACERGRGAEDPSSQQAQQGNQSGQPGYGAQGYGQTPPAQPGQPTGQAAYGQAGAAPVGQQPGGNANPSPLALPCQSDLICGTHKCNLQTGHCSFPCSANTDCAAGFSCMGGGGPAAICIPGAQ